ncbi:hypothetical protein BDA99DRAFT_508125 [Phascolomyces articulosus]|uniref:Uncharacterized protein n=1 Tax=Phascolomyces articulosus TaxID=60185 RepID=A0AAD5KC67_9FUNG|nr:hypothetical protein BDA99DRAFT_508125 [Phascolomyces articulosus]
MKRFIVIVTSIYINFIIIRVLKDVYCCARSGACSVAYFFFLCGTCGRNLCTCLVGILMLQPNEWYEKEVVGLEREGISYRREKAREMKSFFYIPCNFFFF